MALKNIGGDRPKRFCPECTQVDDHPRHVRDTDPKGVALHMDCCAARGCPEGVCGQVIDAAGDKRGGALLQHITQGA